MLLLSDSSVRSLRDANVGTIAAFVIQCTTNKAAILRACTRMIWECTAIAGATMGPGRLHTLFAEKAMAPFPAILGCARITMHTVLILKRNTSLAEGTKSVSFFRRKDYFVGWNVGENSHRGLFSTGLSMFVKCVIIIIHLEIKRKFTQMSQHSLSPFNQ